MDDGRWTRTSNSWSIVYGLWSFLLSRLNQICQLIEIIERLRIQFSIFDADAKVSSMKSARSIRLNESISPLEMRASSAGDNLIRLLENFLGNEFCDGVDDFSCHK
jgi:hypothetical protein